MRRCHLATALFSVVIVGLCGCASAAHRATRSTEGVTTPVASSATTAVSAEAAPAVLLGTWIFVDDPNIVLILKPNEYHIRHPPEGVFGRMSVRGQEIDFLDSSLCHLGTGRYRWRVEQARLYLASITPDPCGRSSTFDGGIFRRAP